MSISTSRITDLRRATAPDRGDMARVLASAFFDDPSFVWLVPDPEARESLIGASFGSGGAWLPIVVRG